MLTAKATVNVTKRLTAEVRTETLKIQRKYNVYRAGKDKARLMLSVLWEWEWVSHSKEATNCVGRLLQYAISCAIRSTQGDGKGGVPSSIEDAMADAGLPIVKPGDASVAAPFTSRIPSVRSVVDLIRQGALRLLRSNALMPRKRERRC